MQVVTSLVIIIIIVIIILFINHLSACCGLMWFNIEVEKVLADESVVKLIVQEVAHINLYFLLRLAKG